MASNRPYRDALPYVAICEEITQQAGKQFDPRLVHAFLNVPEAEWDRLREQVGIIGSTPKTAPPSIIKKAA